MAVRVLGNPVCMLADWRWVPQIRWFVMPTTRIPTLNLNPKLVAMGAARPLRKTSRLCVWRRQQGTHYSMCKRCTRFKPRSHVRDATSDSFSNAISFAWGRPYPCMHGMEFVLSSSTLPCACKEAVVVLTLAQYTNPGAPGFPAHSKL